MTTASTRQSTRTRRRGRRRPVDAGPTPADWYKDAIIYEVHVRAFQDSNGDGIGDFKGSAEIEPGLTTVRLPAKRIGRGAADMIAALIDGRSLDPPRVLIPSKLMLRNSTCALANRETATAR